MKTNFSSAWIENLNSLTQGGVFFFGAILTVAPGDVRRYADTQDPITFAGFEYTPLGLRVEGWGQTAEQSLPTLKVTVSNVTGEVGEFLETRSLIGNDCVLHVLHLALLGTTSDVDSIRLQVMSTEWNWQSCTITLGINVGLSESIPRGVIAKSEFPGVPDNIRRASIL